MESQKSNNPERFLLGEREYTIPEGHEAVIEGCKVIVRKKESEDETIRKNIISFLESHVPDSPTSCIGKTQMINWLEKQKYSVSNAKYIEDVARAYADGGRSCAVSFIEFLDKNSYAGKMCVSNPECADIDKAFFEKDWAKVIAYADKYLRDHGMVEEKPGSCLPSAEWSEDDEKRSVEVLNGLKYAYSDLVRVDSKDSAEVVCRAYNWFENRLKSIRPTHNNIHWRRAKAGENLPESIIMPDGDDPRFGKCAVNDSYYIPIEELKNLPKDES